MKLIIAIQMIKELEQELNEYAIALQSIRGKDWTVGIDKDPRKSIKTLKALYEEKQEEINKLLQSEVIENTGEGELLSL